MSLLTISIPEELVSKLKKEKNYSGLVTDLVRDYYIKKGKTPKEMALEEIEAEIEKRKREHTLSKEALIVFEEARADILATKEEKEKKEAEKREKRIETFKDDVRTFCNVEEEEVQEIAEMFETERLFYNTFFDWCDAKGIELKKEYQKKEQEEHEEEKEA